MYARGVGVNTGLGTHSPTPWEQTYTCENITLPQPRLRAVTKFTLKVYKWMYLRIKYLSDRIGTSIPRAGRLLVRGSSPLYAPKSTHDMKVISGGGGLYPVEVIPIVNANCRCKKARMTGHAISKNNTVKK